MRGRKLRSGVNWQGALQQTAVKQELRVQIDIVFPKEITE